MKIPDDKKKNPGDRFRNILSSAAVQKKENVTETRRPPAHDLPRPKPIDQAVKAEQPASPPGPQAEPGDQKDRFLRFFWTFASVVSLIFNAILIVALITVGRGADVMNPTGIGSGLLGGLYSNFERMDAASIKANIPVRDTIPLNLSIPVQTTTGITLAQDAVIRNAHVKIATATFNIDSNADVTLPAGTSLNVILDFSVPVQASVPVSLNVPVNIALKDTELHPAIAGLESTIQPLYCVVNPSALSINGSPICPLH